MQYKYFFLLAEKMNTRKLSSNRGIKKFRMSTPSRIINAVNIAQKMRNQLSIGSAKKLYLTMKVI